MGASEDMSLSNIILNEVNVGRPVLYHFTEINYLFDILKSDTLISKYSKYISLTRNHDAVLDLDKELYVRFCLDLNRLKDFYKLEPYIYGGEYLKKYPSRVENWNEIQKSVFINNRRIFGREGEERIKGQINRLHRFLIQIDVLSEVDSKKINQAINDGTFMNKLVDSNTIHPSYKNIPINIVDEWSPVKV